MGKLSLPFCFLPALQCTRANHGVLLYRKQVKASQDDPKVVLESNSSGKICVHKVDNVYFD